MRRRSKSSKPHLYLATVISKQNYHELPLLAEFARTYGFAYWYIIAEYPHNPGRDLLSLTPEDLGELERIRAHVLQKYSQYYSILFNSCIGLPCTAGECWSPPRPHVFCTAPWARFELKATGDVRVCPYFREPISSMNGKSFPEIWNGPEFRRIRHAFTCGTGLPSYCINCTRGFRTQYLPGYPGLADTHRASRLLRMIRRLRA